MESTRCCSYLAVITRDNSLRSNEMLPCLVLKKKKRDVAFDEAAPNMFTYQHSPVYIYSKSAGGMRIYDIRGLIWTTSWNGLNGIVTNRGRWYRGTPSHSHQPSSPYHMCERVWQRQRIGDKQPWAPCAIYRHLSVYIYIYIHASRYDNNNNNTTSSSSNRTRNTTHTHMITIPSYHRSNQFVALFITYIYVHQMHL